MFDPQETRNITYNLTVLLEDPKEIGTVSISQFKQLVACVAKIHLRLEALAANKT